MTAIVADDNTFSWIEIIKIPIRISLKFVPRSPIDNKPAMARVMAWRRTGDKPLPEPMMSARTDMFMQERRNSSALAMELRLSCTN